MLRDRGNSRAGYVGSQGTGMRYPGMCIGRNRRGVYGHTCGRSVRELDVGTVLREADLDTFTEDDRFY